MMLRVIACVLAISLPLTVNATPEWVLNPPQNEEYILGVGVGSDRAEAKSAALSEIVSQLSIDFSVKQVQLISANDAVADVRFKQSSQMSSIPFSLEGIEELNSAKDEQQFALLLGIKKTTLIAGLHNRLTILSRLSPVKQNPNKRFIWALSYGQELDDANRRIRVLDLLGEDTSSYVALLTPLLKERRTALDLVTLRVIASQELAPIKSSILKSLPQTGESVLWLKANLTWKYDKQSVKPKVLANLHLTITEPEPPFKELYRHTLTAQATASSVKKAKQSAIDQLQTQVKSPISQWMLDSH
ncbi:hypothetical protein [Shewanella maritima]|uniref:hypothetical protein n=1 Tax=Shewanella maritima TaxID=2520507 RepID=UPI003734D6B1